jgi:hypothetical protein
VQSSVFGRSDTGLGRIPTVPEVAVQQPTAAMMTMAITPLTPMWLRMSDAAGPRRYAPSPVDSVQERPETSDATAKTGNATR